eukprot:scaffold19854_cov23-Prasinocladus_malaysianus.AAC.1
MHACCHTSPTVIEIHIAGQMSLVATSAEKLREVSHSETDQRDGCSLIAYMQAIQMSASGKVRKTNFYPRYQSIAIIEAPVGLAMKNNNDRPSHNKLMR